MARHHYVPRFLLREWATNGYFVAYQYCGASQKSVQKDKTTVASSCQIEDLNAFFGASGPQRNLSETAFFTPRIDTPAARALQVMLKRGVRALTPQQRIDWARPLVSFGVRAPDALRDMGPKEAKKAFDLVESTAKGLPADEQKVTSIIQQNMPALQHNIPLAAAVDISFDPSKLEVINGMEWWIRRWDKNRLLIGDRPLLAWPRMRYPCGIPLDNDSCLIVLPIGPRTVFFASANSRTRAKVRAVTLSKLARIVNEETIWRSTRVFAADKSLAPFVLPRIAGKATGAWQPSPI